MVALIGMDLKKILLSLPFGIFLGMPPRLETLEVLLGGLIFQISPQGMSMLPSVNFLVWLVDWQVLDQSVHDLNPARHELFHLWRIFLAC